jgi:hypothetical protein
MITVMEKGELSNKLHMRIKVVSVGLHCGVNNSTIRFIKEDEDNCRRIVNANGPNISCEIHSDSLREKMGRATFGWLGEEAQRRLSATGVARKEKAMRLYN